MCISRRRQLTIHDSDDGNSTASEGVKQRVVDTPTDSPLSSPLTVPNTPPGVSTQFLTALGNRLDEAQQGFLSFNNILLRAADECEAERCDISPVGAATLSAEYLQVPSPPSVSRPSATPSSPSLMAQADSKPSLTIPSHLPSTYPTPADKIDRHVEFETETSERRATSRESRDMRSDITAEPETELTKTKVSGGNDSSVSQSKSQPNLTPNQTTPSSSAAPESSDGATDQAGNITSDMANEILPDVKEVANSVQNDDLIDQKTEVKATEETIHKERTISEVILAEVQASNRVSRAWRQELHTLTLTPVQKTFVQGDVAIVIDASDLTRTLLLPSKKLLVAAPNLPNRYGHLEDVTIMKRIFVLTNPNERDETAMPRLQNIDPTQTRDQFIASQHKPITRARAAAEEAKLKKEEEGTIEDDEAANSKIDWLKAYRTVFAVIVGFSRNYIFKSLSDGGRPLLPQILGVINVVGKYDALLALRPSLELLIKDFMQARTLWKAVADGPLDWLTISHAARDAMVYEEAMIHLVGSYPIYGEQMREQAVPVDIQTMVKNKSRDLEYFKMAVDQELMTLNLEFEVEPDKKGKKKESSKSPVDDGFGTAAGQTHYQWLRYVARQSVLLQNPRHNGDQASAPKLMSFYRSIHAGGDSYLPADELLATWSRRLEACRDEKMIRETLKHLKHEASKIVAPLTKSTLQYEQKEELEYLTCVEIDESDIPWEKEEDDVEMEDD
jgi:hypothetical protein